MYSIQRAGSACCASEEEAENKAAASGSTCNKKPRIKAKVIKREG
jgi:hypothetical protein